MTNNNEWQLITILRKLQESKITERWSYGVSKDYSDNITINFIDKWNLKFQHFIGNNQNKDGWVLGYYTPMSTEIEHETDCVDSAIEQLKQLIGSSTNVGGGDE